MKSAGKIYLAISIMAIAFLTFNSCRKDENDNITSSSSSITGVTLAGMVVDEANAAVSGATITYNSQTVLTDAYGTFVIENVAASSRIAVSVSKSGYMKTLAAVTTRSNGVNNVRVMMMMPTEQLSFSSGSGQTAAITGGAQIVFPAGGYVTATGSAYTGTVNAAIKYLSPSEANFGRKIPGSDLRGVSSTSQEVVLNSFGMLGVELTGSAGEALQLGAGSIANITMPVDAQQQASAPATIPLWHLDETNGKWLEEGQATKSGNNYIASVGHFSWWNQDVPYPLATLKGKVVDCNNAPMPNIAVTFQITYYSFVFTSYASTDNSGEYNITVPANFVISVQVEGIMNGNIFPSSNILTISPISTNQTFYAPDFEMPCITRIIGTLNNCNQGRANGFVGYNYQGLDVWFYINTGNFDFPAPPNVQLNINAYNALGYASTVATTGNGGTSLTLSPLILCNVSGTQPENSFYITGGGYNNTLILIDTTYAWSNLSSGGISCTIHVNGINNATGLNAGFSLFSPDTFLGNHVVTQLCHVYDPPSWFAADINNTQMNVNLQEVDHFPGGRMRGTFSGTMSDSLSTVNVIISNGKFNVRNNF